MNQFEDAIIEISGRCNARCKWCVTGRENRNGSSATKSFMTIDKFKQIYTHITQLGLIGKKNDIMLYSWGEPFLNPQAIDIFDFLSMSQQMFSVSTNGSVYRTAKSSTTYEHMISIAFSLPGFSQQSYDRMHGFDFNSIQDNIARLLDNMRMNGFKGSAEILFHVYRFNQDEISPAKKFADSLGAKFMPYYAYLNGLSLARKFVNGTMSEEENQEVQDELCLHYLEKRLSNTSSDIKCRLRKILTIDEEGNLVICCAADKQIDGYVLGNILSFDCANDVENRLNTAMLENVNCRECHSKRIDAWLTQFESWER